MIEAILPTLLPGPAIFHKPLARVLGFDSISGTYARLQGSRDIETKLMEELAISVRVCDRDLERIPKTGAAIIVANHPTGLLDGAALSAVLRRVRGDVRFLANDLLARIPELRDRVLPVNMLGSSLPSVRQAVKHLSSGGCLVLFPAGEVSHLQWPSRTVEDSEWTTSAARLVERLRVSAVPVYISAANSALFKIGGARLRTALLIRELLNKRNQTVEIRIGAPIDHARLLEIPSAQDRTDYMRWRTYLLKERGGYKTHTSRFFVRPRSRSLEPIRSAVDPADLAAEIENLDPLVSANGLAAYIATAAAIPNTMQEIGRLREITFRAGGEGTGKAIDLDRFDDQYLHLFLWHAEEREIVGAYRLCSAGAGDLYTNTLFRYGTEFLHKLGPALELGRSFIRPEYQRGFAPLLTLWKGIGRFLAQNPQYRTLFGPVSISSSYQSVSRELMVTYLERHASLSGWMSLVTSRNPFRRRNLTLPQHMDLEDLSIAVADLEPNRNGIPVLLRQYLRLGGKLLGFNVDPDFSNALDGLILVDLLKTERKLLERYLGKPEAEQILAYHERA